MANCNDCICSEVCYYKSFNDVRVLKKRRNDVEKICKSFVHRDRVKGVEIDQFKNAPTVDSVEVVHGQWVWNEENQCWICSVCELSALNDYRGNPAFSEYCSHCGADMRERITDEDN